MSGFRGFSENQIQHGEKEEVTLKTSKDVSRKQGKNRKNLKVQESPTKDIRMADDNNDDPPPEAFLSRQTVTNSNKIPTTEASKDPDVIEEALKEASPKVEQMQKRQKEIEEENKKKRKLLLDTITERKKQTDAEEKKLAMIQLEIQKIDLLVSSDIKFLRSTIEEASLDFLSAQKRYDKAEKEFVDAKLQLHQKQERKDLLTEHLMTIIEDSELRKAEKLAELMQQLQIPDCDSTTNRGE